jgi:hypothetical protein
MIQVENRYTDLDEILYEPYSIEVYTKIVLFTFPQSVIPIWQTNEILRWDK